MTADEVADLIESGETTRVREALHAEPSLLTAHTAAGETLLHVACRAKMPLLVTTFIGKEVDLNVRDARGRTPLHAAVAGNSSLAMPIVDILLVFGADRTLEDDDGLTPEALARREVTIGLDRLLARLQSP